VEPFTLSSQLTLHSQVCKRFRDISNTESLWQALLPSVGVNLLEVVQATSFATSCKMKEILLRETRRFRCFAGEDTSFLHVPCKPLLVYGAYEISGFSLEAKIACSLFTAARFHSLALTEAGLLYQFSASSKPYEIPFLSTHPIRIIAISAGSDHNVVLGDDGKGYGFGSNKSAQLGFNSREMEHTFQPIELPFPSALSKISCGFYNTVGLTVDKKTVFGCGFNGDFQLSIDRDEAESTNIFPPRKSLFSLPSDSDLHITSISSGFNHTFVVYSNGRCFSVGFLSPNLGIDQTQIARADLRRTLGGSCIYKPRQIFLPKNVFVVKISCGLHHSALLTREGECFVFGDNYQGQCGVGEDVGKVIELPLQLQSPNGIPFVDISCGNNYTVVINIFNQIYAFGSNRRGQCAAPQENERFWTPRFIEQPVNQETDNAGQEGNSNEVRMRIEGLQSEIGQLKKSLEQRDKQIQEMKREIEQQNERESDSAQTIQDLKQQLKEH